MLVILFDYLSSDVIPQPCAGQPSRNILYEMVVHCLDSSIPHYCVRRSAPLSGQMRDE